jgi:hypothetical protein
MARHSRFLVTAPKRCDEARRHLLGALAVEDACVIRLVV